jgi:hypothetical protein
MACPSHVRHLALNAKKEPHPIGCVSFVCTKAGGGKLEGKNQERDESMKAKKNKRERSEQMQQVSAGLQDVLGMTQWRKEHPQATWAEIEAMVDEQINQLRAQLIQNVVLLGEGEDWSQKPTEERPTCATCGKPLWARGEQTRYIQTTGGEAVKLTRTYGTCPTCGVGFFPPR